MITGREKINRVPEFADRDVEHEEGKDEIVGR